MPFSGISRVGERQPVPAQEYGIQGRVLREYVYNGDNNKRQCTGYGMDGGYCEPQFGYEEKYDKGKESYKYEDMYRGNRGREEQRFSGEGSQFKQTYGKEREHSPTERKQSGYEYQQLGPHSQFNFIETRHPPHEGEITYGGSPTLADYEVSLFNQEL